VRIGLLVFFGALGTLARYGMQGIVQEHTGAEFPTGTLAVNLLGCLLLGGVAEFGLTHLTIPPEWRIGITTGFFGAFTTFSTFSWETIRMLEDGEWGRASAYVAVSLFGGLVCAFIGMKVADRI
jgi:fluoride exporter